MIADGFDSPVGTADERRSAQILPGRWLDANPFGTFYTVVPERVVNGQVIPARNAFHTGADINLPEDQDAHAPIYAVAHGTVTYAKLGGGTWGKLVVIVHTLPSGQLVYSRYAHLESIGVRAGQPVTRGEEIGRIGNAEGQFPYHLHFDVSLTSTLGRNPEDWPGADEARLKRDYVPPLDFIRRNRPMQNPPAITPQEMIKAAQEAMLQANSLLMQALAALTPASPPPADQPPITTPTQARVNAADGVNVRAAPTVRATKAGSLAHGTAITVLDDIQADGYQWCKIVSNGFAGCYVAKQFLAFDVAVDDPVALG